MLDVIVRCMTADGFILGSEPVGVDVRDGRGFPVRPIVVTISAPGHAATLEAYIPALDQSVLLPSALPDYAMDAGTTIALYFNGWPMLTFDDVKPRC